MKAKKTPKEQPVIVTTEHRGVFFGYATDVHSDPIELRDARMCVYWSADMRGIMGLAAKGPSASCKISPAVPKFQARKVTGVLEVTKEAEEKWLQAPWA